MKDKVYQFLEEWLINFLKNKDILKKDIKQIDKKEGKIIVISKTKTQIFLIEPFIKKPDKLIKDIEKAKDFVSVVVLNATENFDIMMDNWAQLIKYQKLSVYFVNPFSKLEKKWIIYPRTHNLVSEKVSLKLGLLALFNTVEVLNEEEIKKILRE